MPAWDEEVDAQLAMGAGQVLVQPSAPSELMWFLLGHTRPKKAISRIPVDPALAERARLFWSDGARHSDFTELLILAHRGGHLLERDAAPLLANFDNLARQPTSELRLASESADDRAAILVRLERLRSEKPVRQRYLELLQAGWSRIESLWRSEGLAVVDERVREIRERLERGSSVRDLLPEQHIARHHNRPDLGPLIDESLQTMTVAVSPIYFTVAGSHIVELGDLLHVGLPAREVDTRERLAYVGEHVARKLKVLSDPSRVAILADLVRRPASITELADRFQLAQPTVSMHIKALRDAQLLTATKNGTRTTYGVDAARLREQFEEIETLLLPKS